MAVRTVPATDNRRTWLVAVSLIVLFAAALFLRAYWNLDAAQQDGQFVLAGGSDPYYHKRAVDAIQANGFRHLVDDPMLNYPYGSINPNPPLYQWSVAVAGQLMAPFFDGDVATSTWWAMEWSPAVYGALTLIPIYFIGAALFDRRVGIVAALFWTLATSAIDTTGLGDADHDAAIMFFASLAFLFYIKTVQHFRGDGNWVRNWRDGRTVGPGIAALFRDRRAGFLYAALTGISIGAVALIWKGFPYVIGIFFIYAGLQMVLDHWRNRDSTGLFLATLLAMVLGVALAYPYYALAEVGNFMRPVWFIIGAFVVGGLVLVPTRDMPTILVFPAALVAAILGAIVAFFVVPEVAQGLLYATVYFKQTALYETIAEAQPADFSTLVFGVGPVPFFLALAGWFTLLFTMRRHPTRAVLFALVWGAVALFMAKSAVRFVFNAIPIIVVFGAYMLVWVIDWLDFSTVRKSLAANRGNFWAGFRKGVRPMHVVGVILVALLLVVPNVMLAADAALPPEDEARIRDGTDSQFVKSLMEKRFGAYGQGFIPNYWVDALNWLDDHDANVSDPAQRGAFLSWWDYGHWAIALGNHPAVADNFQNGYVFAAYFILAQNETHAVQLLAARQIDGMTDARAEELLAAAGAVDARAARDTLERMGCRYQDPNYCRDGFLNELDLAESVALLAAVEAETGTSIRYFAADVRMLPYDNPDTPNVEQSSIFYAPIKLAQRDPEDYLQVKIRVGSSLLSQKEFEDLARNPISPPSATAEEMRFTEQFFNSMYWRAYVGAPAQGPFPTTGEAVLQGLNQPSPAGGMTHFRLVYANEGVKIIEYTPGAKVTGTITQEGQPVEGATLTVFDDAGSVLIQSFDEQFRSQVSPEDFNVGHASTRSDASGRFDLLAPFALEGGNITLVASKDGVELARSALAITREDAAAGKTFETTLDIELGAVEGVVFEDKDGDGRYTEANDTVVGDVNVTVGGKTATTGADGKYRIDGVPAGRQNVTVDSATYRVSPRATFASVRPGEPTTHDVPLDLKPATVTGIVYADIDEDGERDDGETLGDTVVRFLADEGVASNTAVNATTTTDAGGNYTLSLRAGAYTVAAEHETPDGTFFQIESPLVLSVGETKTLELRLVKTTA